MEMSEQELNISELRRRKRPLWMSDLGIDNYADILGGGGDIWTDRLPPAWPRHTGMELSKIEEQELGPVNMEEFDLPGKPEMNSSEFSGQLSQPSYAESMENPEERGSGPSAPASGKKTMETATGRVSAVVGSLKGIFKGKERKEE